MKQAEHRAQRSENEGQEVVEKGPTIEMFEEKQLLAVHMELKEKVAMEKQAIIRLSEQIGQQRRAVSPPPNCPQIRFPCAYFTKTVMIAICGNMGGTNSSRFIKQYTTFYNGDSQQFLQNRLLFFNRSQAVFEAVDA